MKHIITIILVITCCFLQTTYAQICINPQNNVGISNDNPINGKLDVLNNTSSISRISINNQNSYSGPSEKVGISNTLSHHGNNSKVGLLNIVTQDSNNNAYCIFNELTSSGGVGGQLVGTSNWVINAAGEKSYCYGFSTNVVLEAKADYACAQVANIEVKNNTGTVYGTRNGITINGSYSVDANGIYNQMNDNFTGGNGYRRGIFNQIRTEGDNGDVRGIHNVIETNGTSNNRDVFGLDNQLDCETTGTKIGINNRIENRWVGGNLKGIQNYVISRSNAQNVRGIESTVEKNHNGQVYGFLSRLILPYQYGNNGINYGIYSTVYKDTSYNKNNGSIYGIYSAVNENFTGYNDTEFYSGFFKGQDVYIEKSLYVGGDFKACYGVGSQGSIQKIENSLPKLNKLNPIYYKNLKGEKRYSFNTEELRNIYPELTKEVTDPEHPEKVKETAIDYLGLIPILVDAINEQSKEIEELKMQVFKIDSLEDKIQNLINAQNDNLLDAITIKTVTQ